jgi:hypothetical protein
MEFEFVAYKVGQETNNKHKIDLIYFIILKAFV